MTSACARLLFVASRDQEKCVFERNCVSMYRLHIILCIFVCIALLIVCLIVACVYLLNYFTRNIEAVHFFNCAREYVFHIEFVRRWYVYHKLAFLLIRLPSVDCISRYCECIKFFEEFVWSLGDLARWVISCCFFFNIFILCNFFWLTLTLRFSPRSLLKKNIQISHLLNLALY